MGSVKAPRFYMDVIFYRFDKAKNETRVPSGGDTVQCYLKEECSVMKPRLILSAPKLDYNYFYIPDFHRYYFITDYVFMGNRTYAVHGEVDSMGSFRDSILASSQYVERAAIGYDVNIMDTLYPAKAGRKVHEQTMNLVNESIDYTLTSFIIGVVGKNAGYCGVPVTYYLLDYEEMRKLNDYLFNTGSYGSMISDDIVKAFFNPMDSIVSCMVFPNTIVFDTMTESNIDFGWFTTSGITAYIVQPYDYSLPGISFEIFKPGSGFVNSAPWTQYSLYVPFMGRINIPPEKLYGYTHIHLKFNLDLVSGALSTKIYAGNTVSEMTGDPLIAECSGQMGAVIAMAQLRTDLSQFVGNVMGGVGSALTGNVGGLIGNAVSAVDAITPDAQTKGTNGGLGSLFYYKDVIFQCYYFELTELNTERLGRPVCRQALISSFSGYCKCSSAEISAEGAYSQEIDEITSFMNGGFYAN